MITTLGKIVMKNSVRIPEDMLTEGVAGSEYMLRIQTNGVANPKETIALLRDKLKDKGITVVYGEVSNNVITLQVKSSVSIQFVELIAFLPQILSIIGVVVALITVYLLVSGIPTWLWGLGAIALVLLFALPKILPKITGGEE